MKKKETFDFLLASVAHERPCLALYLNGTNVKLQSLSKVMYEFAMEDFIKKKKLCDCKNFPAGGTISYELI